MHPKISFILPCLNESNGLKKIIPEIFAVAQENNLHYEIILSDNNSTDDSVSVFKEIALALKIEDKVKVISEKSPGYGITYLSGFKNATGDIYIMADADGSYDFKYIPEFLKKMNEGNDLVVGNRFSGKMQKNAMPLLNKFLGNPVLSALVRIFFNIKIKDIHSGMRAIRASSYKKLNLYTRGMEFASEMIIQAGKKGLKMTEIDIDYRNRIGHSKLKAFRDGWKHLRFILIYSPYYVFIFPGIAVLLYGLVSSKTAWLIFGYQMFFFGIFNKFYAISHLGDEDKNMNKLAKFLTLEKMIGFGFILLVLGVVMYFTDSSFGLSYSTLINLGIQTVLFSFMVSIIGIKEK